MHILEMWDKHMNFDIRDKLQFQKYLWMKIFHFISTSSNMTKASQLDDKVLIEFISIITSNTWQMLQYFC